MKEIKLNENVIKRFQAYFQKIEEIKQLINNDMSLIADSHDVEGSELSFSEDGKKIIVKK